MPVQKRYYDAKDIASILGVGKNTAYEIMHMFGAQKKLLKIGKTLRVRQDCFEKWLIEQEAQSQSNYGLF